MTTPLSSIPLPEGKTSYVRVLWASATTPVNFISFCRSIVGRHMHWGDKHSEVCLRPEMHCPWCKARYVKRWYGWLYGRDELQGGPALLQLTETAVRQSISLRDSSVDLRGAQIELFRHHKGNGSFVQAAVELCRTPERYNRGEPNTLLHLFNFYKIQVPQLGDDYPREDGEA